ncbi:MAG: HEAT repeat domain-containing protein, partial [Acidobacteria bacterium]|nr:HEAT repeat domain-containing protein [Acidobacteriota bacterium]
MKMRNPARVVALLGAVLSAAAGCATTPPPKAPVVPYEQKLASILQLEDQRILRVPPPPAVVPVPVKGGRRATLPAPPAPPDLTSLIADPEPRVRRRSALAIGRVGLPQGVQPLIATLADPDPEVRQ